VDISSSDNDFTTISSTGSGGVFYVFTTVTQSSDSSFTSSSDSFATVVADSDADLSGDGGILYLANTNPDAIFDSVTGYFISAYIASIAYVTDAQSFEISYSIF